MKAGTVGIVQVTIVVAPTISCWMMVRWFLRLSKVAVRTASFEIRIAYGVDERHGTGAVAVAVVATYIVISMSECWAGLFFLAALAPRANAP